MQSTDDPLSRESTMSWKIKYTIHTE